MEEFTEEKMLPPAKEEAVLMDFSNTFKSGTRGFAKKGKKKVVAAEVGQEEKKESEEPNKDLEDENFLKMDEVAKAIMEIPRNLTITKEQMA